MNQYPVRRFSITFRPEYERVDSQGRVVGHYRLPISVMEQPRLKALLQQALDDYGLIVQNQRIVNLTDHVIVEVTIEPIFYEYYGTTNLTTNDFRTYMLEQFNTETKEDTWKGGDLSFQIVDPTTGKTVTSYLDLFVDQVTELTTAPAVAPTMVQPIGGLSTPHVSSSFRPGLTFGAITPIARPTLPGLASPSRGTIAPTVLPMPPSATTTSPAFPAQVSPLVQTSGETKGSRTSVQGPLPAYPSRLSQGGYIARTELPAAITQLAQSSRVVEYKQTKKDGSTTHYYLFKPANAPVSERTRSETHSPFTVKIKFDRSGQPQQQVDLIYGMADPATNPKLKLVRDIMTKEGLSVLRQLAGRYPHLLGMIDSVQL